jgi:hypothetical protein
MEHLYVEALSNMEETVHELAARLPPPQLVKIGQGFEYRYVEKHLHQAIVQKLARMVSAIGGARLLLRHGFIQEQGALHRMIDETQQDINFLVLGTQEGGLTDLHERALDAFWKEEFADPEDPLSTQDRPMPPRQKIRAALANSGLTDVDPSTMVKNLHTISKAYSGYVHGASPHIMEMFGGTPPHFHMSGLLDAPLHDSHREDLWNYFHRGICAFALAAKAFGDAGLFEKVRRYSDRFVQASGMSHAVARPS